MSRTFCAIFDINSICPEVRQRNNEFIAKIQNILGDRSATYWLNKVKNKLRSGLFKNWKTSIDEAWINKLNSKIIRSTSLI